MNNIVYRMSEETNQQLEQISTIFCIILISLAILYLIYILIYYGIKENKQKDYINTLDDHDKAVICSYKSIKPFERKKKNNE